MSRPAEAADAVQRQRNAREKVAILLLALGNPLATRLLQSFDPRQVKAVMGSAASIGRIERGDLEVLVDEFSAKFARALGIATDYGVVKNLVEGAFAPGQLNEMLADVPLALGEPIWPKFGAGAENLLVPYLLDEHPQTIAFIMSALEPDLAAKCLAMLPREARDSAAKRMLRLQPVKEAPALILQECLQRDLLAKGDSGAEDASRSRVASIMNKLDREQSEAILESLQSVRPDDAKKLRNLIFSFEDVASLEPKYRLAMFDKVPTEQVISALRGTTAEFRELVLSALGARARRMAEAELAGDTGQITKEVLAARRAIADLALAMAHKGDIALPGAGPAA